MYKELTDILWLMEEKAKVTGQYAFIDPVITNDISSWSCLTVYRVHEKLRAKSILYRKRKVGSMSLRHDGEWCPYCVQINGTPFSCKVCFWGQRFGRCGDRRSVYDSIVIKYFKNNYYASHVRNIASRLDMMKIYRRFNASGTTGI